MPPAQTERPGAQALPHSPPGQAPARTPSLQIHPRQPHSPCRRRPGQAMGRALLPLRQSVVRAGRGGKGAGFCPLSALLAGRIRGRAGHQGHRHRQGLWGDRVVKIKFRVPSYIRISDKQRVMFQYKFVPNHLFVYLEFTFNGASCILFGKPMRTPLEAGRASVGDGSSRPSPGINPSLIHLDSVPGSWVQILSQLLPSFELL